MDKAIIALRDELLVRAICHSGGKQQPKKKKHQRQVCHMMYPPACSPSHTHTIFLTYTHAQITLTRVHNHPCFAVLSLCFSGTTSSGG